MNIFIVVPAWNEAKNIRQTLADLRQYYLAANIVVVDDGSKDNTFSLAKAAGVNVLRHKVNRGQGAALQTGTDYALAKGADIIVHFDADGQHQAKEVAEWITPVVTGQADIAIGSRFLGKKSNLPLSKKIFFKLIIPLHNLFIGLPLTDFHNGTRVLSREAAKKIRITQDKMAHNSEISGQISHLGLRYREIPVKVTYTEYGSGLRRGWGIISDLFKRGIID